MTTPPEPDSLSLGGAFPCRGGAPILTHVEPGIFTMTYFAHCMSCGFCGDACCDHGVDVEEPMVARILERAEALEHVLGIPRDRWFSDEVEHDADFPGGAYRRTSVVDGRCVFRSRAGRGCSLHAFALGQGLDYHELKPLVSTLFPLTFSEGLLCLADEFDESEGPVLICAGQGVTVYRALRDELTYYFGAACVAVLDEIERSIPKRVAAPSDALSTRRGELPILR
jgi:hypothetical protein